MKLRRLGDSRDREIEIVKRAGAAIVVRIDGREVSAELQGMPDGSSILALAGRHYRIFAGRRSDSIFTAAGPLSAEFRAVETRRARRTGLVSPELAAPMPGKVLKVLVAEGAEVNAGDPILVLEAMKMETTLYAESAARIRKVRVTEGQMVDHGAVLIELSPPAASSPARSDPAA
jgi:biotin carboxyl carrier protein